MFLLKRDLSRLDLKDYITYNQLEIQHVRFLKGIKNMKQKILIVEDEALGAMGLMELLEMWDYETCGPAHTGADAVRMEDDCQPDAILMDVRIRGGMNGIEAARRIRGKRDVPIIFLSGYLEEVVEEMGQMSSIEFLNKPVDHNLLKETLKKILPAA